MTRKFWIGLGAGFCVLTIISAATGNFAVRFEAASQQAQAARGTNQTVATQTSTRPATPSRTAAGQAAQARQSGISVPRIVLTQAPATGLGQFQARTGAIAPTSGFNVYFEATNLASRFENGANRGNMSVDILLRNAAGATVGVQDNAWRLPVAQTATAAGRLPTVYSNLSVNPLNLPDGRYQLVLRIHDDTSRTFADRVLDIQIARNATAGQRLSQATQR